MRGSSTTKKAGLCYPGLTFLRDARNKPSGKLAAEGGIRAFHGCEEMRVHYVQHIWNSLEGAESGLCEWGFGVILI